MCMYTPSILNTYTCNPTYVRLQSCTHLLCWSTLPRGAESRPPPPSGWISPALASHIFHHVPFLMRPNNNNKHFNAPSLRKSHVWGGHESEMVSKPGPWFLFGDSYISEHFHVGASVWEIITYPSTPGRGSLQDVTVEAPCLERCGDFLDVWSRRTFSHFLPTSSVNMKATTGIAKTD